MFSGKPIRTILVVVSLLLPIFGSGKNKENFFKILSECVSIIEISTNTHDLYINNTIVSVAIDNLEPYDSVNRKRIEEKINLGKLDKRISGKFEKKFIKALNKLKKIRNIDTQNSKSFCLFLYFSLPYNNMITCEVQTSPEGETSKNHNKNKEVYLFKYYEDRLIEMRLITIQNGLILQCF